jgi:chromosome segregation ATPase
MTDELIRAAIPNEEEDVSSTPSASEENGNPETSPALNAARRTKRGLSSFLDKAGGSNNFTDNTEHTCETAATVETEIWNTAHKIVEDKLDRERLENRRKLDRVVQRFKNKRESLKAELRKVQQEKNQLLKENDNLQKSLEEAKKNGEKTLSAHNRSLERNDRMQTNADRLRQRIEKLEQERYGWIDERSRMMCTLWDLQAQVQRQNKTKKSFTATSIQSLESIPEDEHTKQREPNTISSTMKEEQTMNREAILSSQLENVTEKFEFQGKLLQLKNDELSSLEASKKILSDDLASLSKKYESLDKTVVDLRKDVQTAKDSRRPLLEENKLLRHEVCCLQEKIEMFSEQVALQQSFVKNIKDHVNEDKVIQLKHADVLLRVCREFEGSCKKFTELKPIATTPRRHRSRNKGGQHSSDPKRSAKKVVESVEPPVLDKGSEDAVNVAVESQLSGKQSNFSE